MTPETSEFGGAVTADETIALDQEAGDDRSRMSFLDHLDELRRRLIYSLYALIAACLATFYFWQDMYVYLVGYFSANSAQLMYTQPMAGFMFSLKIAMLAGVILASPFLFSQLWLFVAPGLYAKEKKIVIPFVLFSTVFFGSGAWFAHTVAFPSMWQFFASYSMDGLIDYRPNLVDTFSLYVKVVLGLGLVFQMPMLVFFLARFGIVTAGFMIRHFKYAFLGIVVIAAIITPTPDIATLLMFVGPMVVLYVISIGVAWVFGKKKRKVE